MDQKMKPRQIQEITPRERQALNKQNSVRVRRQTGQQGRRLVPNRRS